MASLLLGPPKDADGNVKKIPKVAVYVAGAAFAVTTGLTLLVLPFVKQAAKMNHHTQFLSNRHLARPVARQLHASAPAPAQAGVSGSAAVASSPTTAETVHARESAPIQSPELTREKRFNDDEERSLYGALEGEHEYVSPWLGAQALGLATALVVGSAALGMWGVAKVMGVQNMDEFASKMRETLLLKMPALSEALTEPPNDGLAVDHIDPAVVEAAGPEGEESVSWAAVWDEIARSGEVEDSRPE